MKVIGITGGIGSGKSAVLHILEEEHHAYIVETDRLAHRLMLPGEKAYQNITAHFGKEILQEDGRIDRAKLGSIVFKDKEELAALNSIVHPAVKEYIIEDIAKKRREDQVSLYVIEAALLIEDGYRSICDELWYVYVEREERIRRLLQGRGGTRQKWEAVIANQSDEEYYKNHCDKIVENGQNLQNTADVVRNLLY